VYRCQDRKECKVYLHASLDFDFEKYCSKEATETPSFLTYNSTKSSPFDPHPDQKTIHAFNWPHTCNGSEKPILIQIKDVKDGVMDKVYFQKLIEDNPCQDASYIKKIATIDKKFFKDKVVEHMIQEFRRLKFPREENEVLNPLYCKTLDSSIEDQLDFYQGRGEIMDKKQRIQKYVVFGTKFSLRILAKAKRWYLDGTFKIVPRNYKQMYIIIAKYDENNYPCVYLLLTSRSEVLYSSAFSHIKNLLLGYNFTLEGESAMLDYELAARNALKVIFPNLILKFDYFHFSKCLWARAQKLKLCNETILNDTTLLIAFLKMLIHIAKEERNEYYEDINSFFSEKDKAFKPFLDYFKSNWLNSAFIDFKSLDKTEINERTNNACEGFNRVFNKHIGLKNAPLAMYVSKLKELELFCRSRILKKISQGESNAIPQTSELEKLPILEIFFFLEKSSNEIAETKHYLRSKKNKMKFIENLETLNMECYSYFLSDQGLQDVKSEEGK